MVLSPSLSCIPSKALLCWGEAAPKRNQHPELWEELCWGPNGPPPVSIQVLTAMCPPPSTLLQFLNQENHMSRTQLLEVEARLQSALAALQERSLQHEELVDSQQRLRYRPPPSPPPLEPLWFWETEPFLGVGGTLRGHAPATAAAGGWKRLRGGKLPKSAAFAPALGRGGRQALAVSPSHAKEG